MDYLHNCKWNVLATLWQLHTTSYKHVCKWLFISCVLVTDIPAKDYVLATHLQVAFCQRQTNLPSTAMDHVLETRLLCTSFKHASKWPCISYTYARALYCGQKKLAIGTRKMATRLQMALYIHISYTQTCKRPGTRYIQSDDSVLSRLCGMNVCTV
jgi:hypothetical protein